MGWLRGISDAFLPDTATISRYTESNTADGVVQDWQVVATGVPCRVSPSGTTAAETAGSTTNVLRGVSDWVIWLPALTDVNDRDRITVTGADRPDARTFEVHRVGERSYEASRELICSLLT
jgi:hypothetical protein